INSHYSRSEVLEMLAPRLPPDLLLQALPAVGELMNHFREEYCNKIHAALLDNLPSTLLPQALHQVDGIDDQRNRMQSLVMLAPYLPDDLQQQAISEALQVALGIEEVKTRAESLTSLIPKLQASQRREALTKALATALSIENPDDRLDVLTRLI